jgi:hypothetical protein
VESAIGHNEKTARHEYPRTLQKQPLEDFLKHELGIQETSLGQINHGITERYFTLPTVENLPLKSYESILKHFGQGKKTPSTSSPPSLSTIPALLKTLMNCGVVSKICKVLKSILQESYL